MLNNRYVPLAVHHRSSEMFCPSVIVLIDLIPFCDKAVNRCQTRLDGHRYENPDEDFMDDRQFRKMFKTVTRLFNEVYYVYCRRVM